MIYSESRVIFESKKTLVSGQPDTRIERFTKVLVAST